MGLLDRIKNTLASMGPDNAAMVTQALEPGDVLRAHALATPAGFDTGAAGPGQILTAVVNTATEVVSKKRHMGGEEGSIARSLPTAGEGRILAITDRGVSVWDFGVMRNEPASAPEYRIAREHIASLVDTGSRVQGGGSIWRLTFSDGSFFGYRIHPLGETFAEAAAALGRL